MFPEFKVSKVENIIKWKEYTIDDIKKELLRKGELETRVYMYYEEAKEGVLMFLGPFMGSNRGKDVVSSIIKMVATRRPPDGIIFATEAYVYMQKVKGRSDFDEVNKEAHKYGSIKDHPDNIEVLWIAYEDRNKSVGYTYRLRKNKKGRPVRLDKMEMSEQLEMEGRFAQFIKGKPKMNEN